VLKEDEASRTSVAFILVNCSRHGGMNNTSMVRPHFLDTAGPLCIVVKGPHHAVWRQNSGPSHSLSLLRVAEMIVKMRVSPEVETERTEPGLKATFQTG